MDSRLSDLNPVAGSIMTSAPLKQYAVVNPHTFSRKNYEVQSNGQTVHWIHIKSGFMSSPQVNIQRGDQSIAAACKLRSMSRHMRLFAGDPGSTDSSSWPELRCGGFRGNKYEFFSNGRSFTWTRTHNKALGASTLGSMDFKLVDDATGQVLAVWIRDRKMFSRNPVARINYFAELGPELEALSLAAIAAIEEKIKRQQAASSGAAGGGGGA